jgi:hypothetical protein
MKKCSIAILPPSTISLEYLCSGGSLYVYQTAENQSYINNMLIKRGVAKPYSSIQFNSMHSHYFETDIKLIDGKSSKRILNEFLALVS